MRSEKAELEPGQGIILIEQGKYSREAQVVGSALERTSATKSSMDITTFEGLNNDTVCLILDKVLHSNPPGIVFRTLASFACVSSRYASLVKERGWERECRSARPDLCAILLSGDKKCPGDAGWNCFAKLLTRCPGYQSKVVNLVKVENHFPQDFDFFRSPPQVVVGQTRGLETFDIALKGHLSDKWLPLAPWRATTKSLLRAGERFLPGLVRCNKSPSFLLSNCGSSPSHIVRSTYTEWVTQRATPNVWEAVPDAQRDASELAIVRIYRGMVADVSALALDFAHKPGDRFICDNEPDALDIDRKPAPEMPATKHCPFCAKSMQRISSCFYDSDFRNSSGAATAEFHVCTSGHIYGASFTLVSPNERSDDSE